MKTVNKELTRFSDLIGLIYEGATDPGRWTHDVMPAMAQYFQVPDCLLFTPLHTPRDGGFLFMYGRTQEQYDLYASKYQASDDILVNAGIEKNLLFEGNVVLGDELVPRQQWLESKLYTECYSSNPNLEQIMTSVVFGLDSTTSMPAACSFFRSVQQPDFDETDRARLKLVLPHISRSLGVLQRLRSAELTVATSLAALDRLPSGILLLDAFGEVVFANRVAQHMLEDGDGLHLPRMCPVTSFGDLGTNGTSDSHSIRLAINATLNRDAYAASHFSQSIKVPRPSGKAGYSLQVSALGGHNEFAGGKNTYAAIVFIDDDARKVDVDPLALQRAYGLTSTEATVAITLLEFVAAKGVGNVLGMSPHTVRTHIRAIYAKFGVDTRTRFVKLMLGQSSLRS